MQWWNDIVNWFSSAVGIRVVTTSILPFVAILVAGIIGALIGRSSARRVIEFQDREAKASAVAALIGAGRKAAVWNTLTPQEKEHVDRQASEAEVRVRLLPVPGSTLAADWATHELSDMKKNSANFSFQAGQTLSDFRDRLIEWQHAPAKARKAFRYDLERWKFEEPDRLDPVIGEQQEWASKQVAVETGAIEVQKPAPGPLVAESFTPPIASAAPPAATPATTSTPAAVDSAIESTVVPERNVPPLVAAPTAAYLPEAPAAPPVNRPALFPPRPEPAIYAPRTESIELPRATSAAEPVAALNTPPSTVNQPTVALVYPHVGSPIVAAQESPAATADDDDDDDDYESLAPPPVTASAVRQRIAPPAEDDPSRL